MWIRAWVAAMTAAGMCISAERPPARPAGYSATVCTEVGQETLIRSTVQIDGIVGDPRMIEAMQRAWGQTATSWVKGVEAGFRVDADGAGYKVVNENFTNETMMQRISIVPGKTIAIFHVHPKDADPKPSPADKKLADTWSIRVYVMHISGLYVYDPVSKQSRRLRKGVSWLKP